jgi:hypothetical protein
LQDSSFDTGRNHRIVVTSTPNLYEGIDSADNHLTPLEHFPGLMSALPPDRYLDEQRIERAGVFAL